MPRIKILDGKHAGEEHALPSQPGSTVIIGSMDAAAYGQHHGGDGTGFIQITDGGLMDAQGTLIDAGTGWMFMDAMAAMTGGDPSPKQLSANEVVTLGSIRLRYIVEGVAEPDDDGAAPGGDDGGTIQSLALSLMVTCPSCGKGIPVNGAADVVQCDACQSSTPLTASSWSTLLGYPFGIFGKLPEGKMSQDGMMMGDGLSFKWAYGKIAPTCAKCEHGFDAAVVATAAESGAGVPCPCGEPLSARSAPVWFRGLDHRIRAVAGEALGPSGDDAPSAAAVKIHCISCGGGLEVDGSSRNITCTFCSEACVIPDTIWRKLHPVKTRQPFFVLIAT